jgi:integrase
MSTSIDATAQARPQRSVQVPLERGVRVRRIGETYKYEVTDGTGANRMTAVFDDAVDANEYKRYLRACRTAPEILERPTADRWLAARHGGPPLPALGTAAEDPLTLIQAIGREFDECGFGKSRERRRTHLRRLARWAIAMDIATMPTREVDIAIARKLPLWLLTENHGVGDAKQTVRMMSKVWTRLVADDDASKNPFEALDMYDRSDLPPVDRRGRRRDARPVRAYTPAEVAAIALLLPTRYRYPFWLFIATGARRSEVFGLRLGDWDDDEAFFTITTQRQASPAKGDSTTKTAAGERDVPPPDHVCEATRRYIAAKHPPRPDDTTQLAEWRKRYLIVGDKTDAMSQQAFSENLCQVYAKLGLDYDHLGGYLKPIHHLRATLATWAQGVPSSVLERWIISAVMGHDLPDGTAPVTRSSAYHRYPRASLLPYRHAMNAIFEEIAALLGNPDLLAGLDVTHPMTIVDAANITKLTTEEITEAVRQGALRPTRATVNGRRMVVFERDEVLEYRRQVVRATLDTYSGAEVVAMLQIHHTTLDRMLREGTLTNVALERRHWTGGGQGLILPGGGRRFPKAEVDAIVAAQADRLQRRRTWHSIGEAAALLGCSRDTVRRLADAGTLERWIDPLSYRNERFVSPDSVERYRQAHRTISVRSAAEQLGVSALHVSALIKTGVLRRAQGYGEQRFTRHVLLADVERYAAERARTDRAA